MAYGWYNHGMGTGWWVLMIFGMIVFWSAIVIGLVAVLRHYRAGPGGFGTLHGPRGPSSPAPPSSAVDILKERFAKGELTEEQYSRRLALLREHP